MESRSTPLQKVTPCWFIAIHLYGVDGRKKEPLSEMDPHHSGSRKKKLWPVASLCPILASFTQLQAPTISFLPLFPPMPCPHTQL